MRAVTIHAAHIGYACHALDCPRRSATLNLIGRFVRPPASPGRDARQVTGVTGQPGTFRPTPESWTEPRRSQLEAAAFQTAPGCLRLHARVMLSEWGLGELADTAELLVSEIATNAVQSVAATTSGRLSDECPCVELRLSADHHAVVAEVWDGCPDPPQPASLPGADALSGRAGKLSQPRLLGEACKIAGSASVSSPTTLMNIGRAMDH